MNLASEIEFYSELRLLDKARLLNLFMRSEEHTSELQLRVDLVCRLLLEKKKIRVTTGWRVLSVISVITRDRGSTGIRVARRRGGMRATTVDCRSWAARASARVVAVIAIR